MEKEFPELPGWSFEVEEVSPGVYRVVGRDIPGRTIEASGVDPNRLLEECKKSALEMMTRHPRLQK